MITEDYVSFEVAKLLRDKGFKEPTFALYYCDATLITCDGFWNHNGYVNTISAPTQQMAMRWLREVHKLCIVVYPVVTDDDGSGGCLWDYSVYKRLENKHNSECLHTWYEEAIEAALKYCLTNLI